MLDQRESLTDPGAVLVADVLIPVAVDQAYSYIVGDLVLAPGDLVEVPLGPRVTIGVVWSIGPRQGHPRLKAVSARCDLPPLPDKLRAFVDWIARWTLAPRGMVLRMCLRAPLAGGPAAPRLGVRATGRAPTKATPTREMVMATLGETLMGKSALATAAGCGVAVVNALLADGALELAPMPVEAVTGRPNPDYATPRLSKRQSEAARALVSSVERRAFDVTLLQGVTGSGKTEVYFEAIAAALQAGRQALILLPEIALTAQFLDRFTARFGTRPAEWHSAVGARRRTLVWHAVASGEAQVVAGARSALFLPFKDLALIVVDEEHEAAYKQEDGVTYHARDMAVVRGRIEQVPVVLASATPSIETQVNSRQGRYAHLDLPGRFGDRPMPNITALDLKRTPPPRGHWIAPGLELAIKETIANGEQALLFLNRRGYAPLTLCRACGHRFQCPNCSAWLVEHRFRHALVCHHCGHQERRPEVCPVCEASHALIPCGPGIERLAEEVAERFPDARALVLSSDFLGGTERLREELVSVANGRCDIVIGTQLVAKGRGQLSAADPRRRHRCRHRLVDRRSARGGTHVPVAAAGDRPGRALRSAGAGDPADLAARASGDPRAVVWRCRALLCGGNASTRAGRAATVRPPRVDRRLGARFFERAGACACHGPGRISVATVRSMAPRRCRRPAQAGRDDPARPSRGPDRGGRRPTSLPAFSEGATSRRSAGIFARAQRGRATTARWRESGVRYRSAELFVTSGRF